MAGLSNAGRYALIPSRSVTPFSQKDIKEIKNGVGTLRRNARSVPSHPQSGESLNDS
jgi:hypothetical protein